MADPLPWDRATLVPSSEEWAPRGGTRTGGQSFEGAERIVVSPTARWQAKLSIPCFYREHALAMRRVIALGRTQSWLIGPNETTRAPWNTNFVGGKITYGQGEKSPDVYGGDTSAALAFALSAPAAMNDTSITVARTRGGVLEPGMIFSIGNRLHVIVGLTGETGTPGKQGPVGIVMALAVRPWLRADYGAGTALEFGRPLGTMRLASDDTGAMDLQLSKFGTVTLDLVEAFA